MKFDRISRLLVISLTMVISGAVWGSGADPVISFDFSHENSGDLAPGPRSPMFTGFSEANTSGVFGTKENTLEVHDSGSGSPLDFSMGDSITMEAWVSIEKLGNGHFAYVMGKGRSGKPAFTIHNQNYSMRLAGKDGKAALSFLFRDARSLSDVGGDGEKLWHRWTSRGGFSPGNGWHHIALTYQFGHPDSIRGYIDGKLQKGQWDMGGATTEAPVIDDDSLYIGSGNGGNAANHFHGRIDALALYREALSPEILKSRFHWKQATHVHNQVDLPEGEVLLEIFEGIEADRSWQFAPPLSPQESHVLPSFALHDLPEKYSKFGVREDRSTICLIRMTGVIAPELGQSEFLLRSLNGSRVFIDGELVASNPFISGNADGHGDVGHKPENFPTHLRFPVNGHHDQFFTVEFDRDEPRVVTVEAILGGSRLPLETGEISLTRIDRANDRHMLVTSAGAKSQWQHTDSGWQSVTDRISNQFYQSAREARNQARSNNLQPLITQRHEATFGKVVTQFPHARRIPEVRDWSRIQSPIDRFIQARLEQSNALGNPLVDDLAFLRRLSIDSVGVPPTESEIETYLGWSEGQRRKKAIAYFLDHPGWADNWVAYWQDVLAENPAILKPTLNNTGPFRYWIRESFADNVPYDEFVRQLVMMEGSRYGGGPAGFAVATQNDVPMADKAQIIGQAFLAKNLACARCHDAPFHEVKQEDLFGMAAMLNQKPIKLPESSSVPIPDGEEEHSQIEVSLKPGSEVDPHWALGSRPLESLSPTPGRKQLAEILIEEEAFLLARVFANRLWARYLGRGIIEPVDDWESARNRESELLDWMALRFIEDGFNVKKLASLIFSSEIYQRVPIDSKPSTSELLAAPLKRRMSAEQIVDSALAVTGRRMEAERLTLDNDGKRLPNVFLNLGYPQRAWEFTGLSNDRDRPALSMPRTQEIVDFLKLFGWRESRQNPVTVRNDEPNPLQPAGLANSQFINARAVTITNASRWLHLTLKDISLDQLIDSLYLTILTRHPNPQERQIVRESLETGFDDRIASTHLPEKATVFDPIHLLSWSNHLNAKATDIKLEVEKRAGKGDPPTELLHSPWRENLEDVIWALMNSPEFIYLP